MTLNTNQHAKPRGRWWWIALAWVVFSSGLLGLGLLDHELRMRDGDVHGGGIGAAQGDVLILGLAAGTLALAWYGSGRLQTGVRLAALTAQALIGFVVYAFAAIAYVCGSGIDCF